MHLIKSVPCRHHIIDVTTGEIRGFVEVKNFMPAFMPTKENHDAFFKGERKLRFQFW